MAAAAVRGQFTNDEILLDTARGKTQRHAPRPYITAGLEKDERPKILVMDRSGRSWEVEGQSELVATIASKNIMINRIYARPDVFEKASDIFREAMRN
jgi:hypothetical protein